MADDRKQLVAKLARGARGGLVTVEGAAGLLRLPQLVVRRRLAMLVRAGWLSRVRRGLYLVLPLEAGAGRPVTPEDHWVLAHEAYAPCYVGGWSAAEHWGLTEQIFRSTFVVTAANIRERTPRLLGAEFTLVRVPASRLAGTTLVWRGAARIPVSGRERTLVDALRNPAWVGGVRHLAEMLASYRAGREADLATLLRELATQGNGAARKRFGYLAERLWPEAVPKLGGRVTAGVIKLDPAVKARGELDRRWGLWGNVNLPSGAR